MNNLPTVGKFYSRVKRSISSQTLGEVVRVDRIDSGYMDGAIWFTFITGKRSGDFVWLGLETFSDRFSEVSGERLRPNIKEVAIKGGEII